MHFKNKAVPAMYQAERERARTMNVFTRYLTLGVIVALALYGCNIGGGTPAPDPGTLIGPNSGSAAAISLSVTFNTAGQEINYTYTVKNIGDLSLTGPVTVADNKAPLPACAAVNTVGNLNNDLDKDESVTCTSKYAVTQNDLTAGSVVSTATAQVGGISSNTITTTVPLTATKALTVTVTPSVTSYNAVGQTFTYTFVVKNTGSAPIGTAATQFIVTDNKSPATITNCSTPQILAPTASLTCQSPQYTVTQNDMAAANITNTFTASGDGVTSPPVTSIVAKAALPGGNFTKGSNITHNVVKGEWLYQIARCYGADIKATLAANPQIPNPHFILPAMSVTVPNIGSNGTIYGPPCVGFHVVQAGDTLETIKSKYNAAADVLQAANRTVSFASLANGTCLKIPLNSAGGATPAQAALSSCLGTSSPPQSPTRAPIVVTFPQGQTTVTMSNTVDSTSKLRFQVGTSQGQTLSVKVTTTAVNEISMGVFASNGATLKAQDTTLTFTGQIPSTGTTEIHLVSVTGTNAKAFTIEISITNPASTSPFERAADVNLGAASSDPAYLAVFNGQLFFRATGNNNAGAELWRYDPTTKTPSLAKDINPGPTGSDPAYLTTFNGALYFRANGNDGAGVELWRWNGSDAGRLTDINPGAGDANPSHLAVFNNMLYFAAKGSEGNELWRTDGTSVTFVADINTGTGDSNPAYLTVFNNALYFSAISTDGKGVELYKYDGTNAPTRITDLNPDLANSNPSQLAVFNNALYFSAVSNDNKGVELYKYDGTNPPTRVTDINPEAGDAAPSFLTVFQNALYFSATSNDGKGFELWVFDGTNARLVGDLNTAGSSNPSYLIVFNNELYFSANGNDTTGTELWKFKGSPI